MKRILALLIAALMMISSFSALAEGSTPPEMPSGEMGTPPERPDGGMGTPPDGMGTPPDGAPGGFGGGTPPGGRTSSFDLAAIAVLPTARIRVVVRNNPARCFFISVILSPNRFHLSFAFKLFLLSQVSV